MALGSAFAEEDGSLTWTRFVCILRCCWFSKAKSQISQLILEFVKGNDDFWVVVVDGDEVEGDAGWNCATA